MSAAASWAGPRGAQWATELERMEAMLAPVDEPLLRALDLEAPARIADLACGGGATARELAARAPGGGFVHGLDVSSVLVARARARAEGDPRLAFDVADVATFVPPAPYDRLVSRFGVMFFDDPPAAFANLARWLAPGGKLAFAVWAGPAANPWMSIVKDVVAGVVDVPSTSSDGPGLFRYAEPAALPTLLARAGFTALDVTTWHGALPIGGGLPAAEAARFALRSFATFGELLAAAGEPAAAEAERALTVRFAAHETDARVHLEAAVHLVTGSRS